MSLMSRSWSWGFSKTSGLSGGEVRIGGRHAEGGAFGHETAAELTKELLDPLDDFDGEVGIASVLLVKLLHELRDS